LTVIQEGLLWFDDSPTRAMADKIGNAVRRYHQKYGHNPDVCYVHPAHLNEGHVSLADGIQVLPAKSVLPHHFWLGVLESSEKRAVRRKAGARVT
jgi:hypothetical protein